MSSKLSIEAGIPQGSVLRTLLFLLYVNDLLAVIKHGRCTSFADDTTILWIHKNPDTLAEEVNLDLRAIKGWCDSNLLSFVTRLAVRLQDQHPELQV